MALGTSPRKTIPLSSGDDWELRPKTFSLNTGPALTKRAFFCAVVVEGPNDGENLSEDVQDLVASLGDTLTNDNERELDEQALSPAAERPLPPIQRTKTDASVFADSIDELVATERSYVSRIRTLKDSYADPLRSFARSKDSAIIPAYEANVLFGNIDQLVPVNQAFLRDLEIMISPNGESRVGGIGDVALKHFKTLRAFDCYKRYYTKREEAQAIFKREMEKSRSTGFASFIERTKYATTEIRNRVGLRELLMEPVQRIPRYTLLFSAMLANMPVSDPQRAKLAEASEYASGIALAETDDHTKLATTMYRLSTAIDGFPANLISSGRRFLDCIDVEDNCGEAGLDPDSPTAGMSSASLATPGSSSSNSTLHCTLFLFNDKLIIAKRNNGEKSGRSLAGLDAGDKFPVQGSGSGSFGFSFAKAGFKKSSMSCKGVIDITDVVATDVTGPDIHLYLENPPYDTSDRWSGRPLRVLSVVHPPATSTQDPMRARTEASKRRFLENLWHAQALYRTRGGGSVALVAEEQEVESRGGKIQLARTYYNVYQRSMFLKETRKSKVVLHVDSLGNADPLPFGVSKLNAPFVVIRVHPMPGELCRYTVTSNDPDDDVEEDIVQTARVPGRVVQTIHQYGLFKFKTNAISRPATPSGGTRSRAHIFGLDVISRNLFGALPGSSKGDQFGSINGASFRHRRTKSTIGRMTGTTNSHQTGMTTNTMSTIGSDSVAKFSSRSNSTAATSVSHSHSEESFIMRSVSKSRKLIKRDKSRSRSRSPSRANMSETESPLARQSTASSRGSRVSMNRRRSRSVPCADVDLTLDYSDPEERMTGRARVMNASELDLTRRLELARKNSRNQRGEVIREAYEGPVEESIYEEGPPVPTRPSSQQSYYYSDVEPSTLNTMSPPHTRPTTPTPTFDSASTRKGRSNSLRSRDRRPLGPRAPSPLPPTTNDLSQSPSAFDIERALENTLSNLAQLPSTPSPQRTTSISSQIPRSKRLPFLPTESGNTTPKVFPSMSNGDAAKTPTAPIVPLLIKKKTSNASAASRHYKSPSARRTYNANSPLSKSTAMANRKVTAELERTDSVSSARSNNTTGDNETATRIQRLAETTREDIFSSRRALKKIKLEVNSLASNVSKLPGLKDDGMLREAESPILSPIGLRPISQTTTQHLANREANQRMEEMRKMINRRAGEGSALPRRPQSVLVGSSGINIGSVSSRGSPGPQELTKKLDELVTEAEQDVARAASNHVQLEKELQQVTKQLAESSISHTTTKSELRSTRTQIQLLKQLLNDAITEKEILYESFNEELDKMFNDVNLPADEAWEAMNSDLMKTKMERNNLAAENSQLKRRLEEAEMQRDQWEDLLRSHGLIP